MKAHSKIASGVLLLMLAGASAFADPLEDGRAALSKKDYASAVRAFGEAAAKGDVHAQTYLGIIYELGLGVTADPRQALQWLNLASDGGDAEGQTMLGEMYAGGRGIPQDYTQALKYYALAIKQNFAPAQYDVGRLYYAGAGTMVRQDYARAMQWYLLAAKQGEDDAQYGLGYMYFYGIGTPKNFPAAVGWLKQSAAQDNRGGESLLGYAYDNGYGVPQDYALAIRYYKRAAQHGDVVAQALLGEKYSNGQGVPQDWAHAYMLLSLAAADANGAMLQTVIKERDIAQSHLNKDEIDHSQAAASTCASSNYQHCSIDDSAENRLASDELPQAGAKGTELIASGTGFFVSKTGHLITNDHVVRGCTEMRSPGLNLTFIAADKDDDLALLQADKKSKSFAHLRGGKGDQVGESVVAVGFPLHDMLGNAPIVTAGIVSALSGFKNDQKRIQISASVQPGNSGGPVIGEDGAVMGVVNSSLAVMELAEVIGHMPENINFAVNLATLKSFLKAHAVPYVLAGDGAGAKKSTSDIAAEAAGYTVYLECWK